MKKILVIRYRFIGDTVLTIPFLRNLRNAYPDAQIDMLVGPVSGEVLEECPYIDNLIYFDTTSKHIYENKSESKIGFFQYVKALKQAEYDKAYVLKRSLSSALLAFLAKIPQRIGFNTEFRNFLLTKSVSYDMYKHEIECFLDVLRADNIPVVDNYLENWTSAETNASVNNIYRQNGISSKPCVLICATSGNPAKHWPMENFAKIIEYLSNDCDVQIVHTGTAADKRVYESIRSLIQSDLKNEPVNLAGELSIQESMALINRMSFVIGVDSGILHLASSFRVPVIGLYGPMSMLKWHAWGNMHTSLRSLRPCVPCGLRKKCEQDYVCMKDITVADVIGKIDSYISKIRTYAQ